MSAGSILPLPLEQRNWLSDEVRDFEFVNNKFKSSCMNYRMLSDFVSFQLALKFFTQPKTVGPSK